MNKMNDLENKMKTASDYFRAVPPLDVWDKIEANLKEDSKKPTPFIWLPVAFLLLVLAGAIFYSWKTHSADSTIPATPASEQLNDHPDRSALNTNGSAAIKDDLVNSSLSMSDDIDEENMITDLGTVVNINNNNEKESALKLNINKPNIKKTENNLNSNIDLLNNKWTKNQPIVSNTNSEIKNKRITQKNTASNNNEFRNEIHVTENKIASEPAADKSTLTENNSLQINQDLKEIDLKRTDLGKNNSQSTDDLYPNEVQENSSEVFDNMRNIQLLSLHPVSVISLKRSVIYQRKILQPWRDPIVRCPTFSTRKPIRLFAEANTGIGYPIRKLAAKSDSFSYLERRRESESPIFDWVASIGIGMVIKDRVVIRTGLDRIAVKDKFRFEKQGVVKVIITSYPDGTIDTTVTTGNELYAGNVTHKLLSIPIEIGYQIRQHNWRIGLMCGLQFNLNYKSEGWIRMPDDDIQYREQERGMFRDQLGLGVSAGVVVERLVGDHLGLFVRPDCIYYFNDWSGNRNSISEKYFLPGLRLGVRAYL